MSLTAAQIARLNRADPNELTQLFHEIGLGERLNAADQASPDGQLFRSFKQLSTAQILALHTTPIEVVPIPAAGYYIEPISVHLQLAYGTVQYAAIAGTDYLQLRYTDGSGAKLLVDVDPSTFGATAADAYLNISRATSVVPLRAAVVASLAGAWTTGDSAINIAFLYRVRLLTQTS